VSITGYISNANEGMHVRNVVVKLRDADSSRSSHGSQES